MQDLFGDVYAPESVPLKDAGAGLTLWCSRNCNTQKTEMKTIPFTALLLLAGFFHVFAQAGISFGVICNKEMKVGHLSGFGGISAIDLIPVNLMDGVQNEQAPGNRSLFLVSDRSNNAGGSNSFRMTAGSEICCPGHFFGLTDIECIRYHKTLKKIFFSFEGDNETGIGYINSSNKANIIFQASIPRPNRGIEGLTFTDSNTLWFAYESGLNTPGYTIPFYQVLFDRKSKDGYEPDKKVVYEYPFDRCYCLDQGDCSKFDANWGNGVSEILSIPGEENCFLVLERCFDKGKLKGSSRLYLAMVRLQSRLLEKELLYDFNAAGQVADNLEGMAWGDDENGHHILYIVSDNNFNTGRQINQLIKLRMDVSRK